MGITAQSIEVSIAVPGASLPGTLTLPQHASGMVIFAHGSGSGRLSPRNVMVADWLVERGCATLLFDLLSPNEAIDRRNVFDIELLGSRMKGATRFIRQIANSDEGLRNLSSVPIAYFGASTGAAAALVAAAELRDEVSAVVSRGGRPDLAGDWLSKVTAPTLLLVGSLDLEVIELNRWAQERMETETRLEIIPGASHLFEESGTLELVAQHAADWFVRHFVAT